MREYQKFQVMYDKAWHHYWDNYKHKASRISKEAQKEHQICSRFFLSLLDCGYIDITKLKEGKQ